MRAYCLIIAAATCLSVSSTAIAQNPPSPMPAPPPTAAPPLDPPAPVPPRPQAVDHVMITRPSNWILSGFVGSNFGPDNDPDSAAADFGGHLGYLWRGKIGGELVGTYTPNFRLNNALVNGNPNVNSYMANVIGAIPLGADGRFQPYVSGGLGAVQMRADILNVAIGGVSGVTRSNQSRFGGDLGGGLMGFAGNVGFRADVRFYRAFETDALAPDANTPQDVFTSALLSGLDVWRANVGLALRW
jgi:opacity protein-like surface antigen